METKHIKRIFEIYHYPFKYMAEGQCIFDHHNKLIVDIRGWGYLQKHADGNIIQDNIGELVTELLNSKYLEYTKGK